MQPLAKATVREVWKGEWRSEPASAASISWIDDHSAGDPAEGARERLRVEGTRTRGMKGESVAVW